ncbi:MAG: hypothetical protein WCN95_00325 [bacterium]
MKTSYRVLSCLPVRIAGWAMLSAVCVFAGCEVSPVQDFSVSVSPQRAEIRKYQSQAFVASGGVRYTWSISSTNTESDATDPWGLLSATTGEQVIYTSLRAPEAGQDFVVRILTVTATLGTENASNATARTTSTFAYIYHVP